MGFFLSISEVKLRRFFIPLMKGALTQVLLKLFLRCEQIVQDFMLVNQLLKQLWITVFPSCKTIALFEQIRFC